MNLIHNVLEKKKIELWLQVIVTIKRCFGVEFGIKMI